MKLMEKSHFGVEQDGLGAVFVANEGLNEAAIGFFIAKFEGRAFAELFVMMDAFPDVFEAGEERFGLHPIISRDLLAKARSDDRVIHDGVLGKKAELLPFGKDVIDQHRAGLVAGEEMVFAIFP